MRTLLSFVVPWTGLLAFGSLVIGCSDDAGSNAEMTGGAGAAPATGGTGAAAATGGAAPATDAVPTTAEALQEWLEQESYQGFSAESAPAESSGPHFGEVRTFINPELEQSLVAGGLEHPVGAAAIKELYGDGADVAGYAVMVKVASGTDADTWYFFEEYQGTVYADGTGAGLCAGCHSDGDDYILSAYPLR